jgi:outer membrane protein OmpA-like peptidoglycan-associated protein
MKHTIPFVIAALTGTAAFAQQSRSEPVAEPSADSEISPVGEVFFSFNSAELPSDAPDLAPIVRWANEHPTGSIVLDGSADAVGPAAYNIRLSARRAERVRDRLVAMGVDEDRIVLAIYGEDALRRTEPALDRRVTIWTTHDPLYAIIDQTLVRGKAVLWSRPVTYAAINPAATPEQVATR